MQATTDTLQLLLSDSKFVQSLVSFAYQSLNSNFVFHDFKNCTNPYLICADNI